MTAKLLVVDDEPRTAELTVTHITMAAAAARIRPECFMTFGPPIVDMSETDWRHENPFPISFFVGR